MSEDEIKKPLIVKEEEKNVDHDYEQQYQFDHSRVTTVPNIDFEMNQKNLTSPDIRAKDLKAKIQEYLESDELTRDQVKLLLKQGAEDNNLFLIKEDTYDKLVDSLGLKLDHDNDKNMSDISGMLATAMLEYNDRFSKSPNMKSLDTTAGKFAQMMKSRQILRDKSVFGASAINKGKDDLKKSNNQSINESDTFSEAQYSKQKSVAEKHDPNLMERVPAITNQGLKNWLLVFMFVVISLISFAIFAVVTYVTRKFIVEHIIGWGLLVSRGSALAIMVLSIFLLLFVSYDFMTCCRPLCAGT
jgi:hypothetical protein